VFFGCFPASRRNCSGNSWAIPSTATWNSAWCAMMRNAICLNVPRRLTWRFSLASQKMVADRAGLSFPLACLFLV
jgi:hypothetical protein